VCAIATTALAVAMGIGRFAFTPLLPLMVRDGSLAQSAGAWLAASARLLRGAAPPIFRHMQNVISEIFETQIRRFAAGQIFAVVVQKQVIPPFRVRTAQVPQRIDRDAVMRRMANAAKDGGKE